MTKTPPSTFSNSSETTGTSLLRSSANQPSEKKRAGTKIFEESFSSIVKFTSNPDDVGYPGEDKVPQKPLPEPWPGYPDALPF